MNRFDRSLGILLQLRSGKTIAASALARRFEVSRRTIYRDIEALAAVGVPVYAEPGRDGGFRLVEGYFLPPVTLSLGEATSLLAGLAILVRLRARPFAADLEAAAQKLLAAFPEERRAVLEHAQQIIGFERIPHDSFHPERAAPAPQPAEPRPAEGAVLTTFLQCIFEQRAALLDYHAAHRPQPSTRVVLPDGVFWDRDLWYLVGRQQADGEPRIWRADRVRSISVHEQAAPRAAHFDIEQLLGRGWLRRAMADWLHESPITIRMTPAQAARLQEDWYYGSAHYESVGELVEMTIGEVDQQLVFDLVRWLGPGAELIEPASWRAALATELQRMAAAYAGDR